VRVRGRNHGWTAVVEGVDGWWRCMFLPFRIVIVVVMIISVIVMMLVRIRGEGR